MTDIPSSGIYLSVSRQQRDLLYERIFRHLAGIDAVWFAASSGAFHEADRLGRAFCDELILVMDDLHWGPIHDCDRPIKISTPPRVVRVVLERLRAEAIVLEDEIDVREAAVENRELITTCDELLESIQDESRGSSHDTPIPRRGTVTERTLAEREILMEALRADTAGRSAQEITRSVSDRLTLPTGSVGRSLEELVDVGLLVRGSDRQIVASDGLARVNHLWNDLSRAE
ncbi:MAG TPA: hypothetical protein VFN18_10495 [Solirubrobacterales bacterium]|nr:hypothetical protein [Solirubrobacterales bacterium]